MVQEVETNRLIHLYTPLFFGWTISLMPDSQETAQNFEKRVLQKCLRITFYTYKPVNPFHFL
jgi:hypothetical protein